MKQAIKYLLLLFMLSFFSCKEFYQPEEIPYVISKPSCVIGSREGYYQFIGIEFNFTNTTDKIVSSVYISFTIFDADTSENPLIGSNLLKLSYTGTVPPQSTKTMIISLDKYIYTVPEKPYLIDFFYIAEIRYEDGNSWSDPQGVYYVRSY
jgi:hypothetical protein